MKDGLVRVVAQDGTVWWVAPESALFYKALTRETVDFTVDNGFALYWKNQEKP